MARFRKGTNDHDNDGHKGGSLKAGTRFVPGTTDHDSDGRMGGSLKGDKMMATKDKQPKKPARPPRTDKIIGKDDPKHAKTTRSDETPEAKATLPEKQNAAARQFAKADRAGAAEETPEELTARTAAGLAF